MRTDEITTTIEETAEALTELAQDPGLLLESEPPKTEVASEKSGKDYNLKEDLRFGTDGFFNDTFKKQNQKENRIRKQKQTLRRLTDLFSGENNFQGGLLLSLLIGFSQTVSFLMKLFTLCSVVYTIYFMVQFIQISNLIGVIGCCLAIFILVWVHERIG